MTTSGARQGIRPGVCLSTSRPASPFIGQIVYMTDVNQSAVWDGVSWVGLERGRDRNVVINGAMQVAQRGTSTASITTANYYTVDRWQTNNGNFGTWTQSQEADAPTGSGLRNSFKILCTTADASPAAADILNINQRFEGQNVQQFLKGTASAKPFALSFWVKSNVTGTYIAELLDNDNSRQVSASYTISASATWEKKTIIFPADTTGVLDNNNELSLLLQFWLGAGSDRTSGTLNTTWAATVQANRAVGQTNLAAATSNYWQVTGVQVEVGAVATPFEFEDYSETLRKCQRYYFRVGGDSIYQRYGVGAFNAATTARCVINHPVPMRILPTNIESSTIAVFDQTTVIAVTGFTLGTAGSGKNLTQFDVTVASGGTQYRPIELIANNSTSSYIGVNAEL
jgi:hypothetical protein